VVRRMNQDPQPLLQLDMPSRPPQDPLPPGTGPDSEFVKVGFSRPATLVHLARAVRSPKRYRPHFKSCLCMHWDASVKLVVMHEGLDTDNHEHTCRQWSAALLCRRWSSTLR